MDELTVASLLTVAGNGVFVVLVLQLLVKPWFKPAANGRAHSRYPALMNLAAALIGMLGAIAAQAVTGLHYEGVLQAALVGLGGGAAAVGYHEVGSNVLFAVRAMRTRERQEPSNPAEPAPAKLQELIFSILRVIMNRVIRSN